MKTFVAILIVGAALLALTVFLRADPGRGIEVGTVAAEWRTRVCQAGFAGAWLAFMSVLCLVLFRKHTSRSGWRREGYVAMQWLLAAIALWTALPVIAALGFLRGLYAPYHAGGAPQPVSPDMFNTLATAHRWAALIGLAVLVVWTLVRGPAYRRKRLSEKSTTCVQCAYDLRGNTSGHCPECGTPYDATQYDQGERASADADRHAGGVMP